MRRQTLSDTHAAIQSMRTVGYIRVSTEQQAQEGISLDAQRTRIQAHCVSQDIRLVDIVADEGYSAKSLDRPGLRAALRMLTDGKADAIIVVKLDRLTRSVKDLGHLCDSYFREGMSYSLLSVSDSIDTRSAGGKLLLNVLMSVAQWEREAISERTREALRELRRRGVVVGCAPYGWRYSDDVNAEGHRYMVEVAGEQAAIRRVVELYEVDTPVNDICRWLTWEGLLPRGKGWHRRSIYSMLSRAGYRHPERPLKSMPSRKERERKAEVAIKRDKALSATRAQELRVQGLSLRQIGERLQGERFLPPRGDVWHAATILDLLRAADARRSAV
jgi:DNA invertase Pin-like site-specific DNA recombinase